ncbi:MAG: hypothetical protein WBN30_00285 [Polyangiales bacterium]
MKPVAAAVPNIPREDWTAHPRFRTQALLLGSHANFRWVSRFLVDPQEFDRYYRSPLSMLIPADPRAL